MNDEDLRMLFSMLIKMSKDCASYGINNYNFGWDEHKEEREYFERRLKEISVEDDDEPASAD